MSSASHPRDTEQQCDCYPACLDVASGVLMQRHGLTAEEARGTLLRTAKRQNIPVHARAREVIDTVVDWPVVDGWAGADGARPPQR
jgi:ANTAR domain